MVLPKTPSGGFFYLHISLALYFGIPFSLQSDTSSTPSPSHIYIPSFILICLLTLTSQHFTKVIMKDFRSRHDNNVLSSTTPKKPVATPKKRTPASAKRTKMEGLDDDDDPVEDIDTPSKKVKVIKEENPFVKEEGASRPRGRRYVYAISTLAY